MFLFPAKQFDKITSFVQRNFEGWRWFLFRHGYVTSQLAKHVYLLLVVYNSLNILVGLSDNHEYPYPTKIILNDWQAHWPNLVMTTCWKATKYMGMIMKATAETFKRLSQGFGSSQWTVKTLTTLTEMRSWYLSDYTIYIKKKEIRYRRKANQTKLREDEWIWQLCTSNTSKIRKVWHVLTTFLLWRSDYFFNVN